MTATRFIVRSDRRWHLSTAASDEVVEATLDDVIAALGPGPSGPAGPVVGDPNEAPVDDLPDEVVPSLSVVARVDGDRAVVEGPDGIPRHLDADDLRLLDHIGNRFAVADAAVSDRRRLGLLLAAGVLQHAPVDLGADADAEPGEAAADDPEAHAVAQDPARPAVARRRPAVLERVATAYRLSSKLAPVRRLVASRTSAPAADLAEPEPVEPSGPPGAVPAAVRAARDLARHPDDPDLPGRAPVYSVWHREMGPLLSLGMLSAAARHHDGGALVRSFEIRRPETRESFLAAISDHQGPGILLLSNYVWSIDANLVLAAEVRAEHPELLIVHGGPSSPKYEGDAAAYFDQHRDLVDVLVRGEGEATICELLEVLAESAPWGPDRALPPELASVAGITFRLGDRLVRTADRERIRDLDELPSPYLTGEFDHIEPSAWNLSLTIESNRGCPYGCTFCDWGSDTMSRIRTFDLDRVREEIDWAADLGAPSLYLADANFGIRSRDVDIAAMVAEARRRTGSPELVALNPAKNTLKHLVPIIDRLVQAGVTPTLSLALQTIDQGTLDAVGRSNISVESYVQLAADFRKRGLPLMGDILIGLPGQTYQTYRADLQFMLDHEVLVRTWPVQLLPNAPMNEPAYRARHDIEADDQGIVRQTATLSPADREDMLRLRRAFVTLEVFGAARHLLRWAQWDHDIAALDIIDDLVRRARHDPERYPLLSWLVSCFDLFQVPPQGWGAVYDELGAYLCDVHGLPADSAMETVLRVQRHLMPAPGRTFPSTIELPHDYVSYYRSAATSLFTHGGATDPSAPLATHAPATLEVVGDPLRLCTSGLRIAGDPRDFICQGDFYLATSTAYELDSPLTRVLPWVVGAFAPERLQELTDPYRTAIERHEQQRSAPDRATQVRLGRTRAGSSAGSRP